MFLHILDNIEPEFNNELTNPKQSKTLYKVRYMSNAIRINIGFKFYHKASMC